MSAAFQPQQEQIHMSVRTITNKNPSPTELAVAEFLTRNHIKYQCFGGYATKLDDWPCDSWSYVFSRVRDGKPATMEDKFHTGTGHRQLTSMGKQYLRQVNNTPWTRERIKAENSIPVEPMSASILYCLLSDASLAEQNFHDWCSDMGADTDSIRSLNTYNACCEILNKVRTFFTREERQALQELLEDY